MDFETLADDDLVETLAGAEVEADDVDVVVDVVVVDVVVVDVFVVDVFVVVVDFFVIELAFIFMVTIIKSHFYLLK